MSKRDLMRFTTDSGESTDLLVDSNYIHNYSYPREWEQLILPDQADILKESWKYAWRRTVFYIDLLGLIGYISQFPLQLTGIFTWVWIANILWFELDLTSVRSNILVQFLHGFSFIGSYLGMFLMILVIICGSDFVHSLPDSDGTSSPVLAWILTTWVNFSPPLIVTIDLYLHRNDLIQRHRLNLPSRPYRPKKLARVLVQTVWLFLCSPLIGAIWYFMNIPPGTTEKVKEIFWENQTVFIPVLIISNFLLAFMLLLSVRKVSTTSDISKVRLPLDVRGSEEGEMRP